MFSKNRQEQLRTFMAENQDPVILTSMLQQLNYCVDKCSQELTQGNNEIKNIQVEKKVKSERTKRAVSQDNTCYNPLWLINKDKRRIVERHNQEFNTFLPQFVWNEKDKEIEQPNQRLKPLAPIKGTINRPRILLPKEIRKNPLNQRKRIYESLIYKEGLCNLINKGLIDKHIDVSPAFEFSLMLM
ncbi:unnamed protein product [Paramecium pentaurelia]|uniref:Uncharacterized protein n=1 Tax=Paramecium pentaurelia TaxID=43138 RepID=A0A8S1VVR6_9CILI|nr:unnamed protein product [Paramecium pentaurelia]